MNLPRPFYKGRGFFIPQKILNRKIIFHPDSINAERWKQKVKEKKNENL